MKREFVLIIAIFGLVSIALASEKNKVEHLVDSVITYNILQPNYDTIPYEKIEYNYDLNGNVVQKIIDLYSLQFEKWDNYSKYIYNYDNDKISSESFYKWNSFDSIWEYRNKTEYIYDDKGNKTESILYLNLRNTELPEKTSKSTYYYDNNNNCTLDQWYCWDSELNDWKIWSKTEYTYDINNNCILKMQSTIDSQNELLKFDSVIYQFNESNELTLYVQYLWDNTSHKWIGANKTEANQINNEKTSILSNWSIDKWNDLNKYIGLFDENGNILISDEYQWYATSSNWSQIGKWIYSYDSNNELLKKEYYVRYNAENDLQISKIIKYFSSENNISDIINENSNVEINIWPNPSNGRLFITSENKLEIRMYNPNGQMILFKKLNEGVNSLDIDKKNKGIYFIHITSFDNLKRDSIKKIVVY